MMSNPSFTENIITPVSESPDLSETHSIRSNLEPPQAPATQSEGLHGPVAILWDIENCPVPSDVRPEDVAGNIRMALRVHPIIRGAVTMFSAYGDFNAFPRRLREGCQRTGVKLVDVPNGRKDAADKAILVDMFLFVVDNRPPSSILLISGDVDFAPALHILGQRGYTIILVIPSGVGVSSALSNAGRFVWDWPSVARGEGFVPPRTSVPRGYDHTGYLMNNNIGSNIDGQNEEEAIVYRGVSQSEHSSQANSNQLYSYNSSHVSREFSSYSEFSSSNPSGGPYYSTSRTNSLPPYIGQGSVGDQNGTHEQICWVQPGDLLGLKGQLVKLVEMSGGSMPLVRLPAEYIKLSGRPLYVSEYGVHKLVNLISKMSDTFVITGKGPRKLLCLRSTIALPSKKCPTSLIILKRDNTKGKGTLLDDMDSGTCANMGSSSDDFSDEDKAAYESDGRLESFRMEVQELLVCYSHPIPLSSFKALYEQRYKKPLDYQSFEADGVEELLEKVNDVVELREDEGSKRKFLVSNCVGE